MPIVAGLVGSKIAVAALALAALGGGGAVVATAAGALPTPAHSHAADPTQQPTESPESTDPTPTPSDADGQEGTQAKGPDATGPAAFGLCTAYLAGGLVSGSTAYDSLTTAAGDAGVDAYCSLIVANVHVPAGTGSDADHGKPADAGTHAPSAPAPSQQGTSHRPAGSHGR